MDVTTLILIAVGVLALLGAAAASFGSETRDGLERQGFAHETGPRFR